MFLQMSELVAKRGTCPRAQAGYVIVKRNRPISWGYNGAPPNMPHCTEVGCLQKEDDNGILSGCIRTIHGEANAIAWAARLGHSTEGATMYGTYSPCHSCAQLIVSAGIVRFHYLTPYRAADIELLDEAGVEVHFHGE